MASAPGGKPKFGFSCFENRLLIVPVAEHIAGYIVGIDILRILQPLIMQNLGGHGSLARSVRADNHN